MTNGGGTWEDMDKDLEYFDKLPPSIKKILHKASDNISAREVFRLKSRYTLDWREVEIELKSRVETLLQDRIRRFYGSTHPQLKTVDT